MKYYNKIGRLAVAVTLAGMLSATAFAADVTIRVAHLNPEGAFESHSGAMTTIFKSLVESASGGVDLVAGLLSNYRSNEICKLFRGRNRIAGLPSLDDPPGYGSRTPFLAVLINDVGTSLVMG